MPCTLAYWAFCTFHGITEGRVRLGCDNINGVRRSKGDWLKVSLQAKHADLIRAIRVIKSRLPIKVDMEHVYGHQDDWLFLEELPRMAQLNVEMDELAKQRLYDLSEADTIPPCSSLHLA